MVNFENGVLIGQIAGNHGMSGVYVEIFASVLLFLICLASVIFAHFTFGRDVLQRGFLIRSLIISRRYEGIKLSEPGLLGWQTMSVAILYIGFMGLGEAMEHLFLSSILVNFFRSLTLISPPIALYFIYLSIRKHVNREYETVILPTAIWGTAGFLYVVGILAILAEYDPYLMGVFFYFTLIPVLLLAGFVWGMAVKSYAKHILFIPTASSMAFLTTILVIFMLVERTSITIGNADIYVLANSGKDVLLAMTAASVLIYTNSAAVAMKHLSEGRPRKGPTREPLLGSRIDKIRRK